MLTIRRWLYFTLVIVNLMGFTAKAETSLVRAFNTGSYQQLLAENKAKPLVLVIWSITCPSCIKDMTLLAQLHKRWPALKMVMLATDAPSEQAQVSAILTKFGLTGLDNWQYADENTQKLNYEVDPEWYGELPRTYFYTATHARQSVSGVLSPQAFEAQFARLLQQPIKPTP